MNYIETVGMQRIRLLPTERMLNQVGCGLIIALHDLRGILLRSLEKSITCSHEK